MLNTTSVAAIDNDSAFSQSFIRPRYDSYCFSHLPTTIDYLLTGDGHSTLPLDVFGNLPTRYDRVVFFFVDAFGWRFFERYAEKYAFLRTALAHGVVSKMTAQFPSTTAAHVTCIHTGLPVGQSGVYEWTYYEPLVDERITPLLYSYARDGLQRETLRASGVSPETLFPHHTFYQRLQTQGIASHILQYKGYTSSTYSDIVFRGAHVHPYQSIQQALVYLSELMMAEKASPVYYFLYFDRIDELCHRCGPFSKEFEATVDTFFSAMDALFYQHVHGKLGNTLLLMTADHGQVEVDPKTTYYLNKHIPNIERYLLTNKQGHPITSAGSPRDMFLYVKEAYVEDIIAELRERLAGRAEVYRTQELLDQHFFGLQEPSSTLLARLGNVVILPYKRETVWWYAEGKPNMHFFGHHGGLTREEMEIPLIALPL